MIIEAEILPFIAQNSEPAARKRKAIRLNRIALMLGCHEL